MSKVLSIPWVFVVPIVTSLVMIGGLWADMRITLNHQTALLEHIALVQDDHAIRLLRLENGHN